MPVDFGALAAERASAARLMMTITQILKHVDGTHPVRFLIPQTETATPCSPPSGSRAITGISDKLEITPLFETRAARSNRASASSTTRCATRIGAHLKRLGRLSVQFGYSDSGRYVGQLAATFWIERLRLRITELMTQNGLSDIELVIFDTHGESIGRGAHPTSRATASPTSRPKIRAVAMRKPGSRCGSNRASRARTAT